jgi:hypothetical protein
MEAPLGDIVRKILRNQNASKRLMELLIFGEGHDEDNYILLDNKKYKVRRVSSLPMNIDKKQKR